MRTTRLDSFLTFLGPGGFATPDDVEALESCQAGFRATELEWSDISGVCSSPNREHRTNSRCADSGGSGTRTCRA